MNAENKDEVDRHITATDTDDTLIDSKKKIQWSVTILPIPNNSINSLLVILNSSFLYIRKRDKDTHAISILYQTKYNESKVINFPNIPVKPRMITIKCNEYNLYFLIRWYINIIVNLCENTIK